MNAEVNGACKPDFRAGVYYYYFSFKGIYFCYEKLI
jgi:hypothetical protein